MHTIIMVNHVIVVPGVLLYKAFSVSERACGAASYQFISESECVCPIPVCTHGSAVRIQYSCTRTDTASVTNRSTAAAFSSRCKVVIITESVFRNQHWIEDMNVYEIHPKSPHSRP